jgi:hypothetical protein
LGIEREIVTLLFFPRVIDWISFPRKLSGSALGKSQARGSLEVTKASALAERRSKELHANSLKVFRMELKQYGQ